MKTLIRLEELLMGILAYYLFSGLGIAWWWFVLLFLAPDLSGLGYLVNARVGAWTYNLAHHKGVAVTLFLLGALISSPWLQAAGCILFAHASIDRVFGYGLKYPDSFQRTHLGQIGRAATKPEGIL